MSTATHGVNGMYAPSPPKTLPDSVRTPHPDGDAMHHMLINPQHGQDDRLHAAQTIP
eukprot:m.111883 g.111883  ORF g.111883 m.111883 type:complete len:57 (+) comp17016_c3_seq2:202-372(+)